MGTPVGAGKVSRGMTEDEIEAFLALREADEDSACLKPDGRRTSRCAGTNGATLLLAVPRQRSLWAEYLVNDGRPSFVVDYEVTMEKVFGEGLAELVERPNIGGRWVEVGPGMSIRNSVRTARRT